MRRLFKKIALCFVLVAVVASVAALPVAAQTYNLQHNLKVRLDGDFKFKSDVTTPEYGTVKTSLEGVGKALLESELTIGYQCPTLWWELF